MIKMGKIPLFALIVSVMLSTGGSCVFPMLAAQASSGAMRMDMDHQGLSDGHEDPAVYVPLSQSHLDACLADCEESSDDFVATTKKVKEVLEFPSIASQSACVSPSLIGGLDFGIFESPGSPPLQDVLLAVAKKE